MGGISPGVLILFALAVLSQITAVGLMPRTAGFTELVPTLACASCFVLSVGLLARILATGVNLSILVPLMSAVTPLATVAIGLFVYGEPTSATKVGLLFGACALIGAASRFS